MNYNKLCACVAEDAIHPNFEHSLGQVRTPAHISLLFVPEQLPGSHRGFPCNAACGWPTN